MKLEDHAEFEASRAELEEKWAAILEEQEGNRPTADEMRSNRMYDGILRAWLAARGIKDD